MLVLLNVQIQAQNFGSIIGIFLVSDDVTAINERYYSFFNHAATSGELEWWSTTCAMFWISSISKGSAEYKLKRALVSAALSEILNTENTKETNPWPRANLIAEERYAAIEWVNWFQAGVLNLDIYSVADKVIAETPTGNFNDDVLAPVIGIGKQALHAVQSQYIEYEEHESHSEALRLAETCEDVS